MNMFRGIILLLSLTGIADRALYAATTESCTEGRTPTSQSGTVFPFFGMGFEPSFPTVVTLHLDESLRDVPNAQGLVADAINEWETTCQVSKLPISFRINATDPRPPVQNSGSAAYRETMLIKVDRNAFAEVSNKKLVLGGWYGDKNQIILPGRCPLDGTYGLPCPAAGGYINWNQDRAWTTRILIHELGHAMGLDHDGDGRNCRETVMKTVLEPGRPYPLEIYHCRHIRLLNDHNHKCNNVPLSPDAPHPCDKEVRRLPYGPVTPAGPGGMGHGDSTSFCSIFPTFCDENSHLAWRGHGVSCDWSCVSWQSNYGDKGSNCNWNCQAAPLLAEAAQPTYGAGPTLAFLNVREGDSLAGRPVIRGFAMDFIGVSSIEFYWNGQRLNPRSLQTRLASPEACSLPLGLPHSHCVQNSGFLAQIDTTLLPNGLGTLGMVATDVDGWTSSLEVEVAISNSSCGDSTPPQVQITRPTTGLAVGGNVPVEISAQDDFGVQSVELLVNGQRVGLRTQAPYVFDWNTSSLPFGNRRLLARASDACGNTGNSTEVQVLVDNRQSSYLGAAPALPVRLQAEHYDVGLPGVSYFDSTVGNAGGQLRQDNVDIGTDGGQFVVGYVAPGEWLEYSVDSTAAERYLVRLRSASPSGGHVALAVDGVEGSSFQLPPTGSYTYWTTSTAPEALMLAPGQHILRIRAVTAGFNLDWLELETLRPGCSGGSTIGCLQNNRFIVSARVDDQQAAIADTRGDTVFMTVFDPQNVELAVKILDGRAINGKFWIYHGSLTTLPYTVTVTDTVTGKSRNYFKTTTNLCGGSDTASFPFVPEGQSSLATCTDSGVSVCLLGNRYRVEVLRGGISAGATRITGQTGSFTFFSSNNHEVVAKILDGSTWNGHRWVFFGSLTDQSYQVKVTDTVTGSTVMYNSSAAFCGQHDFDDF